jgi:hypothetical protein
LAKVVPDLEDEDEFEESKAGDLAVGAYTYTILWERARKIKKKKPLGFAPPDDTECDKTS